MRIGISTAQSGQLARPAAVRAVAAAAEQVGYSSVWVLDRPVEPRQAVLDPLAVVAATVAVTTRVCVGAAVLVGEWHHPLLLARSLATLDLLSEGRLSVSLGLDPANGGLGRLEATLDALPGFWSDDARGLLRAASRPPPPLLIASSTPEGLALVAGRAEGWNPHGLPVDVLAATWARVRDLAAGQGRDPDALQLVVRTEIRLTERPMDGQRPSFQGNADQVADDIEAARRAGAHEVVLGLVGDPSLDEALDGYARVAEAAYLRAAAA